MATTKKQWSDQDIRYLRTLHASRALTLGQLADKLGCTTEEITEALERPEPQQAAAPAPEDPATKEAARLAELARMDGLQRILYDACAFYEGMGERLGMISEVVSRSLSLEQLVMEAMLIEKFRASVVVPAGQKPIDAQMFLLMKLYERYILIPRPRLEPTDTGAVNAPEIQSGVVAAPAP